MYKLEVCIELQDLYDEKGKRLDHPVSLVKYLYKGIPECICWDGLGKLLAWTLVGVCDDAPNYYRMHTHAFSHAKVTSINKTTTVRLFACRGRQYQFFADRKITQSVAEGLISIDEAESSMKDVHSVQFGNWNYKKKYMVEEYMDKTGIYINPADIETDLPDRDIMNSLMDVLDRCGLCDGRQLTVRNVVSYRMYRKHDKDVYGQKFFMLPHVPIFSWSTHVLPFCPNVVVIDDEEFYMCIRDGRMETISEMRTWAGDERTALDDNFLQGSVPWKGTKTLVFPLPNPKWDPDFTIRARLVASVPGHAFPYVEFRNRWVYNEDDFCTFDSPAFRPDPFNVGSLEKLSRAYESISECKLYTKDAVLRVPFSCFRSMLCHTSTPKQLCPKHRSNVYNIDALIDNCDACLDMTVRNKSHIPTYPLKEQRQSYDKHTERIFGCYTQKALIAHRMIQMKRPSFKNSVLPIQLYHKNPLSFNGSMFRESTFDYLPMFPSLQNCGTRQSIEFDLHMLEHIASYFHGIETVTLHSVWLSDVDDYEEFVLDIARLADSEHPSSVDCTSSSMSLFFKANKLIRSSRKRKPIKPLVLSKSDTKLARRANQSEPVIPVIELVSDDDGYAEPKTSPKKKTKKRTKKRTKKKRKRSPSVGTDDDGDTKMVEDIHKKMKKTQNKKKATSPVFTLNLPFTQSMTQKKKKARKTKKK